MAGITAFINRYPVVTYLVLTFAISWSAVLLVIGGPSGIPATAEQSDRLFPYVYLAMVTGPSIAGLLLTALVDGKNGIRAFRQRLLTWRVAVAGTPWRSSPRRSPRSWSRDPSRRSLLNSFRSSPRPVTRAVWWRLEWPWGWVQASAKSLVGPALQYRGCASTEVSGPPD